MSNRVVELKAVERAVEIRAVGTIRVIRTKGEQL